MLKKKLCNAIALLIVAAGPLFMAGNALAAGIEVTLTSQVLNATGSGTSDIALFVNGTPLPLVEGQVVSLGVGDVLRAELSASALHDTDGTTAASHNRVLHMDFVLDAGTTAALLQTSLGGTANSTPDVAQGSIGSWVDCDFSSTGCSAPDLPLSTAFGSSALSSTLDIQPNATTINNVTTVTGRVGGIETIDDLVTHLSLQSGLNPPAGSVSIQATAIAIYLASATASGALELTVTEVTAVPIPAVGWLIGPALALAGWRQRRRAR